MKRFWLALILILGLNGSAFAQTAPYEHEAKAYTGLLAAADQGDIDKIKQLIAKGADINVRDSHGRTPVMIAAHNKDHKTALALMKAGANLNLLDRQYYDVLTISGVIADVKMVELALKHGADPKLITSPYDGTALIAAAHEGHDGVVRTLVKAGAPLDHVNNLNWTAVIESIVLGDGGKRHQACLQALIEAGADLNIPDGNGVTPLSLARAHGFKEMVKMLEAAGAKP
ncbi:MAG: ankyrin repeat domain-containing protein [Rhodospirillaceae bacterium]|jgi:ankyrin repeat protein